MGCNNHYQISRDVMSITALIGVPEFLAIKTDDVTHLIISGGQRKIVYCARNLWQSAVQILWSMLEIKSGSLNRPEKL